MDNGVADEHDVDFEGLIFGDDDFQNSEMFVIELI